MLVGVDGAGRARSNDVIDKVVQIDNQDAIIVSPFGVGIFFSCEYPLKFTVSSTTYAVEDVTTEGTHSAEGSLAGGFEMKLNNGAATKFVLGAFLPVDVTWAVTAMSGLLFNLEQCTVTHGKTTVDIIKGFCYAEAVEAKPMINTSTTQGFRFKVFKGFGESAEDQSLSCDVVMCAFGKCGLPDSNDQCPNLGEDALYSYTTDGAGSE